MIKFGQPQEVATGTSAAIYCDNEANYYLIYTPPGTTQVYQSSAPVVGGDFAGLIFPTGSLLSADKGVRNIRAKQLIDVKVWLTWEMDDTIREVVIEDEPDSTTASEYKLYYAVDTEKLYMNISEQWEFIASPRIDLLRGYDELIQRIQDLENQIAQLTGGGN